MRVVMTLLWTISLLVPASSGATVPRLFELSYNEVLWGIDPLTALPVSYVYLNCPEIFDAVPAGGGGLAVNPIDGQLYGALYFVPTAAEFGHVIGTIDPLTGFIDVICQTDHLFGGLAFTDDGTLYAVTSEVDRDPETLYQIDLTSCAVTRVMSLGRGDDGEDLAFVPGEGALYHASGGPGDYDPATDQGVIFERVDPVAGTTTDIPIVSTPLSLGSIGAITWWEGEGVFLWAHADRHGFSPRLYRVTTDGAVAFVGDLELPAYGLAVLNVEPSAVEATTWGLVKELFRR